MNFKKNRLVESLEFLKILTKLHGNAGDNHCTFHPLSSTRQNIYDMMGPFSLTYNIYRPASTHEGVSGLLSFGLENDGSEWDGVVFASSGVGFDDKQGVA